MGTLIVCLIGLPVLALLWVGAGWLINRIWSDLKTERALAKLAESDPEAWSKAMRTREGYV